MTRTTTRNGGRGRLSRALAGLAVLLTVGCDSGSGPSPQISYPDVQLGRPGDVETPPDSCPSGRVLDPRTGACVGCLEDGHCEFGVCHPVSNECVGCTRDDDCRFGVCAPGKGYCVQCFSDEHCSSGHCDAAHLVCVGCGTDRDCDDGNACTLGRCDSGQCRHEAVRDGQACDAETCTLGDICLGGECLPGSEKDASCFPCQTSDQCAADQHCDKPAGACAEEGVCVPRPVVCSADGPRVCGCDGVTYASGCTARSVGVSVAEVGACPCEDSAQCPKGNVCRKADCSGEVGACVPMAGDCGGVQSPVCACGETFPNKCEAFNAGHAHTTEGCCDTPDWLGECPASQSLSDANGCAIGCECTSPADCPAGFTCDAQCGDVGACVEVVEDGGPVCGCDGKTWSSPAAAAASGVGVQSGGPCACPALACPDANQAVDTNDDGCPDACACTSVDDCFPNKLCAPQTAATCGNKISVCVDCVTQTGPMCGCDGTTWTNACAAHKAGVAIEHAGKCGCPDGTDCAL